MTKPEKIAFILAFTQLFKHFGTPKSWCPFVAIAIALILEVVERPTGPGVFDGLILGIMVTGGFNLVKNGSEFVLNKPKTTDFSEMEHDTDRGAD